MDTPAVVINAISYNSAHEIWRMLQSIEKFKHMYPDVIQGAVVIDGGSKDSTVGQLDSWRAKHAAGKLHTALDLNVIEWQDNFATQRNHCLDYTFSLYGHIDDLWVLSIDTDDTLREFDPHRLFDSLSNKRVHNRKVVTCGYGCNIVDAKLMWSDTAYFYSPRFFKLIGSIDGLSRRAIWSNDVHEYVGYGTVKDDGTTDSQNQCIRAPQGALTQKLGHGVQHSADPMRNVRIGKNLTRREPDNARARFYYARDLIENKRVGDRFKKALEQLDVYFDLGGGSIAQDRFAIIMIAKVLWNLSYKSGAKEVLEKWLLKDPDAKHVHLAMAALCDKLGLNMEADKWRGKAKHATGRTVLYPNGMFV